MERKCSVFLVKNSDLYEEKLQKLCSEWYFVFLNLSILWKTRRFTDKQRLNNSIDNQRYFTTKKSNSNSLTKLIKSEIMYLVDFRPFWTLHHHDRVCSKLPAECRSSPRKSSAIVVFQITLVIALLLLYNNGYHS